MKLRLSPEKYFLSFTKLLLICENMGAALVQDPGVANKSPLYRIMPAGTP